MVYYYCLTLLWNVTCYYWSSGLRIIINDDEAHTGHFQVETGSYEILFWNLHTSNQM